MQNKTRDITGERLYKKFQVSQEPTALTPDEHYFCLQQFSQPWLLINLPQQWWFSDFSDLDGPETAMAVKIRHFEQNFGQFWTKFGCKAIGLSYQSAHTSDWHAWAQRRGGPAVSSLLQSWLPASSQRESGILVLSSFCLVQQGLVSLSFSSLSAKISLSDGFHNRDEMTHPKLQTLTAITWESMRETFF